VLTAVESFEKSIELGSRKINMSEVKGHHAEMSMWAYQEGVNYYNEKDFGDAAKYFETCFDIKKDYQQIDTMAAYNAGLAYKLAKNNTKAEELIKYCIETGYQVEQGYLDLLHMYKEAGDEEKYKSTLKEAREKLPNNQDIIQEEINVYLESQEYDKALVNLDQAIANDPSNKALIYARGIILDNQQSTLRADGKEDEANEAYAMAEADYKQVVELDPEGFDGNYSLGALYYNRGAEMLNEANNILDDAKYKVAKAAAEKQLTAALPYLEKAHALNAEDIDTMTSLKTIYARTNQTEKYDAMKEKLEN
jgi:tetratricopeptide (TPR) repeat protein